MRKRRQVDAMATLVFQCQIAGLPEPEREVRFCPGRKFAFDGAFPASRLAVEIDGGVFQPGGGRHNRGAGYRKDCEKFALAAIHGWRVIRLLPDHVTSGQALAWIEAALKTAA